eukprot:TRINITY_DN4831_c0_g1_i1.p1 TRINITY_DN4831_c0_g1~~TRINITY_DN4831_c0_g1_i1.p1  ORF type:complete len:646 (-),score=142.65 TRINITY_DN4831_c0_g1_i1:30-1967(-)
MNNTRPTITLQTSSFLRRGNNNAINNNNSSSSNNSSNNDFLTARQLLNNNNSNNVHHPKPTAKNTNPSTTTTATTTTTTTTSSSAFTNFMRPNFNYRIHYSYVTLAEAEKHVGDYVNLFGVVAEYWNAKPTAASDQIFKVTLADPSRPTSDTGMSFNIFAPEAHVPRVHKTGDVLRLHRVKIDSYGGKACGVGSMRSGMSWVVATFPEGDDPPSPGISSGEYKEDIHDGYKKCYTSKQVTWSDEDHQTVIRLRRWFMETVESDPEQEALFAKKQFQKSVSQFSPDTFVDVVCMLISGPHMGANEHGASISGWVWDGTRNVDVRLPEVSDFIERNKEFGDITTLTNEEQQRVRHLRVSNRDGRAASASFGSVIRFVAFEPHISRLSILKPGSWIKFRNVRVSSVMDDHGVQLFPSKDSETRFLAKSDPSVVAVINNYIHLYDEVYLKEEQQKKLARIQQLKEQALVTSVDHPNAPISTLREIKNAIEPTMKYRSRVRCTGYWPRNIEDFTKPICTRCKFQLESPAQRNCDRCGASFTTPDWVYQFQILVIDESINDPFPIILYGDNATKLFGEINATNLSTRREVRDSIASIMERLTTPGAWVDCCIKSYYVRGDQSMRRYQMFDTVCKYDENANCLLYTSPSPRD